MRSLYALTCAVVLCACHGESHEGASRVDDIAPATKVGPTEPLSAQSNERSAENAPPLASSKFGQPIEAGGDALALADIAKNPAAYRGKVVVTDGTVTRVCQERGCWMAIEDRGSNAVARMHGHSFFVPTTSAGKHARVKGTVLFTKDGRKCDDSKAVDAKLELDATGIELM